MQKTRSFLPLMRLAEDTASHVFPAGLRIGFERLKTACVVAASLLALPFNAVAQTSAYVQTNIISNGAVAAEQTDPTLINPWGISIGPQFWIDSPGSGFSLVENANGSKAFAVAVPAAASTSPHGLPAGTVYNSDTTLFPISGGSAQFLFGTLDGTIAGWNTSTPQAVTMVNNSAKSAAYTDITVDKTANGSFLLAANFAAGTVDVFSSSFAPAHLTGSFSDPTIPNGFAPFGIHAIGGKVFVTYAQRNATGRENVGAGLGYVDVFDANGSLVQGAISQGNLNAPWGMALAPAGFGSFGGDLLVGNFGDGVINAYDPTSFALVGQLQDASRKPIANPGLWEIVFGANGAGDPNTLYFAAGINAEKDGLFGSIAIAAPAAGTADFTIQSSPSTVSVTAAKPGSITLSLASQNGFSGPVALSCSGLPADSSCTFSPASVTVTGAAAGSVTLAIAEVVPATGPNPYEVGRMLGGQDRVALALAGPLGIFAFAGFRRRSFRLSGWLMALVACLTLATSGCGGYAAKSSTTPATGTPLTTTVMVNATAGAVTHSVPITVTLQQ